MERTWPHRALLSPSQNTAIGAPGQGLSLRVQAASAFRRWLEALFRPLRRVSASTAASTQSSSVQLRVVALTNLGATSVFNPVSEAMEFGRPLAANENLLVCLILLIKPGQALPASSLQVTPDLLRIAVQQLDWRSAASAAAQQGLEHVLDSQLRGIRCPEPRYPHQLECHYRCSCGSDWIDARARPEEDRCPVCHTPCFPHRTLDRARLAGAAMSGESANVLDLG
jgi:hypothetical protein